MKINELLTSLKSVFFFKKIFTLLYYCFIFGLWMNNKNVHNYRHSLAMSLVLLLFSLYAAYNDQNIKIYFLRSESDEIPTNKWKNVSCFFALILKLHFGSVEGSIHKSLPQPQAFLSAQHTHFTVHRDFLFAWKVKWTLGKTVEYVHSLTLFHSH